MNTQLFTKNFLKSVAVLLAALLTYDAFATSLSQAAFLSQTPPMNSAPRQRISAPTIKDRIETHRIASEPVEPFRVPSSIGTTVEIFAPAKSNRLIYHLQDVHNHVPAQTNLSEMVSLLEAYAAKQGKSLIVAVEGVAGPVDSDSISKLPDQKRKEDVAAGLLRAGYLLGEEYAAITHAPGRIKLIGVETPDLYRQNVDAREDSRTARTRVLATIRETRAQLEKLKPHNFNDLLTALEKKRLAVEDGSLPLSEYVSFLYATDPGIVKIYPNLSRMVMLGRQETTIDFSKVEKEGKLLVQEVMADKSTKEMEQMVGDAQALKEGRLSPLSYYSILLRQSTRIHPAIHDYVAYLQASEKIDPETLFTEVQNAEVEIAKNLIKHPIAYELYKHTRWIEQREKFFSLNMVPQEWDKQRSVSVKEVYEKHLEIRDFVSEQVGDLGYHFATPIFALEDLKAAFKGARGFYEAAEARDIAMVSNLEAILKMADREKTIAAFIAGGFHTPGVTKLLRAHGLAYEVIRPQLETEVTLSQDLKYPARVVNFLRQPELLATPGGEKFVEQQIAEPKVGEVPPATATTDQPKKEDKGGIVDKAKQVLRDAADPSMPKDVTWVFVAGFALGALAMAGAILGVRYLYKKLGGFSRRSPTVERVNYGLPLTYSPAEDKGIDLPAYKRARGESGDDTRAEAQNPQSPIQGSVVPPKETYSRYHEDLGQQYLRGQVRVPARSNFKGKLDHAEVDVDPFSRYKTAESKLQEYRIESFRWMIEQRRKELAGQQGEKILSLTLVAGEGSRMDKGQIAKLVLRALWDDPLQFIDRTKIPDQEKFSDHNLLIQHIHDLVIKAEYVAASDVITPDAALKERLQAQAAAAAETLKSYLYSAKALNPAAKIKGRWYNFLAFNLMKVKKANDELEKAGYGRRFVPGLMLNERYDASIRKNMEENNYYDFRKDEIVIYYQPLGYVVAATEKDTEALIKEEEEKIATGKLKPEEASFQSAEDKKYALQFARENQGKPLYDLGKKAEGHGWAAPGLLLKEGNISEPPVVTLRRLGITQVFLHNVDNMVTLDDHFLKHFGYKLKEHKVVTFEVSDPTQAEKGRGGGAGIIDIDGKPHAIQMEWDVILASAKETGINLDNEIRNHPDSPFNNASMLFSPDEVFGLLLGNNYTQAFSTFPEERDQQLASLVPEIASRMRLVPLVRSEKTKGPDGKTHAVARVLFELRAWEIQEADLTRVGFVHTANFENLARQYTVGLSPAEITEKIYRHGQFGPLKTMDNYDTESLQFHRERKVELVVNPGRHLFNNLPSSGIKQPISGWVPIIAAIVFGAFAYHYDSYSFAVIALISFVFGLVLKLVAIDTHVSKGTTIESLLTKSSWRTDPRIKPELVQRVIDFAAARNLKVEVVPGIFADVEFQGRPHTLRVGTAILKYPWLQYVALRHELIHTIWWLQFKSPSRLTENPILNIGIYLYAFAAFLINEVIAWTLGLLALFVPSSVLFGAAPTVETADDASYAERDTARQAAEDGKPRAIFVTRAKQEIDDAKDKASGITNQILDLANLNFSAGLDVVIGQAAQSVKRMAERVGANTAETRQVRLLIVNSDENLQDKERAVFTALRSLQGKLGIHVETLGFEGVQALPEASQNDAKALFKAVGVTDGVLPSEAGKSGNVYFLTSDPTKAPRGTTPVKIYDNFLYLALALYAHARYADPGTALQALVNLVNEILGEKGIRIDEDIANRKAIKELEDLMA